MKMNRKVIPVFFIAAVLLAGYYGFSQWANRNRVLTEIISRLEADSRIAEVLVTEVKYDESLNKTFTTIKFLEYDTKGNPLEAKYFTFAGNIIQFQSLVIRFKDAHVCRGDRLKGKSAYVFWKVFLLEEEGVESYDITPVFSVPEGYKLNKSRNRFEEKLWREFWRYALNPEYAESRGVKNAQIEAPGTMFVPGTIYYLKIEHDGGIRIDAVPLPAILRGEKIPG